jgi:hypothetical protein
MQNRTRVILAAAVAAALAAGSTGAALASTAGTKPGARPATVSASGKPTGGGAVGAVGALGAAKAAAQASAAAQPGNDDAFTAAVARELHVSTARVGAALRLLQATGRVDSSSPEFAAAARALGVSPQQLFVALGQAKQSLAGSDAGPKTGGKPGAGTGGK